MLADNWQAKYECLQQIWQVAIYIYVYMQRYSLPHEICSVVIKVVGKVVRWLFESTSQYYRAQ